MSLIISDDPRAKKERQIIFVPAHHLLAADEWRILCHQASLDIGIGQCHLWGVIGILVCIPADSVCVELGGNMESL